MKRDLEKRPRKETWCDAFMEYLREVRSPPSSPYEKRPMCVKRDIHKKTYVYEKRPRKETWCDAFMDCVSVGMDRGDF